MKKYFTEYASKAWIWLKLRKKHVGAFVLASLLALSAFADNVPSKVKDLLNDASAATETVDESPGGDSGPSGQSPIEDICPKF